MIRPEFVLGRYFPTSFKPKWGWRETIWLVVPLVTAVVHGFFMVVWGAGLQNIEILSDEARFLYVAAVGTVVIGFTASMASVFLKIFSWRQSQLRRYIRAVSRQEYELWCNLELILFTVAAERKDAAFQNIKVRFTVVHERQPDGVYWLQPGKMAYIACSDIGELLAPTQLFAA